MLVDDHAIVRSGLSLLINAHDDMQVIATASNGEEAFRIAQEIKPDVIVMDLNMPGENGMLTTARIKKVMPQIEILVLTMLEDREYLFRVLKAGASGYILKSADDMDVMSAIRTVARGEAYLYPNAAKSLIQEFLHNVEQEGKNETYQELTKREQEVISLVAKGHSNKQIAEILHLSIKTIESHRSHIVEKLQLRTRSELVEYAIKKGLLEVD
jgi:two-component system response regulator NreC